MNSGKIMKLTIIVVLTLFVLLLSFKTTIFFSYYTPQQQNAVDYLNSNAALIGNYTEAERSHLQDVQHVFTIGNIFFWILTVIIVVFLFLYRKKKRDSKTDLSEIIFNSGITIVSAVVIILIAIIFNFNTVFTIFHKIFFPQGNWLFPYDSLLILTFPIQFFTKMSLFIFIQALGWGILFILISLYVRYELSCRRN